MCNDKQLEEAGVTRGMLRISVGLEEVSNCLMLKSCNIGQTYRRAGRGLFCSNSVILVKLIPIFAQAEDIISDLEQALQRALLQK